VDELVPQSDYVSLTCPSCGGSLQITPDINRFACAHCGREHIVRRAPGIVSLTPVVGAIDRVREGVDRAAAELSIPRLEREISEIEAYRQIIVAQNRSEVKQVPVGCLLFVVIGALGFALGQDSPQLFIAVLLITLVGALLVDRQNKNSMRETRKRQERREALLRSEERLRRMRQSLANAHRIVDRDP